MSDIFYQPGLIEWHTQLTRGVTQLVEQASKLEGNPSPEKKGGYLTTIYIPTGVMTIQSMIGKIILEKKDKYREFSEEKPKRLLTNPGHILSSQSRCPEQDMWGGAIRTPKDWALGFSGLPEMIDEAVVIAAAYNMGLLNGPEVTAIIKINDNPFVSPLIDFVDGPVSGYMARR